MILIHPAISVLIMTLLVLQRAATCISLFGSINLCARKGTDPIPEVMGTEDMGVSNLFHVT